ncbi:helix-turn-helix domain-containing protein, partial [Candidatus Acetothermia bacterium]|nr:helix-turn-helix domain-containing protein [Candidatus Acetothermia bacterium]
MGKRYEHVSMEERDLIGQMHWQGMSKTMIAKATGRYKRTVAREIRRKAAEQYKRYTKCQAQKRADERWKEAGERYHLRRAEIRQYVHEGLNKGWSPEIMAGRREVER